MTITLLLTAIAIVFWFYVARSQRRLASRMRRLLDVSKIAIFSDKMLELEASGVAGKLSKDENGATAAATTNFLFGERTKDQHALLDLDRIHGDAMAWLRSSEPITQLIVQSLRVAAMVAYIDKKRAVVIGEEILISFGSEYPEAPSPDTYAALVSQFVDHLPEEVQGQIRSRFGASF